MGPLGSPIAHIGVRAHRLAVRRRQHADHDPHGHARCSTCSGDGDFVPCLHSVGAPLEPGQARRAVAVQPEQQVHRPLPRGARDLVATAPATAATRCSARSASRCASPRCMARDEGWLAEHMLILGVEIARGREDLRRRRVPERLRQDQLRDADPADSASRGWKVTTVGDDIAWIKPGAGRHALRDQPRGRLLRRRARHRRTRPTRTRWQSIAREHDLHQRRADRRRRRLVGRHDRRAARAR